MSKARPRRKGVSRTSKAFSVQYGQDRRISDSSQRQLRTTHAIQRRDAVGHSRLVALNELYSSLSERTEQRETMMECPGGISAGDCGTTMEEGDLLSCMEWTNEQMAGIDSRLFMDVGMDDISDRMGSDWEDVDTEEDEETEAARTRKRLWKGKGRKRTERLRLNWSSVYDDLERAFMEYEMNGAPTETNDDDNDKDDEDSCEHHAKILCIGLFGRRNIRFPLEDGAAITTTMVRHGFIPTSPLHPEVGIHVQVLELYRVLSDRCGRLAIEPFVRGICELQKVVYASDLRRQFSEAFDAYLEIRHRIDQKLDNLLYSDITERYNDVCPCCTYTKSDDDGDELDFSMLCCMDGNESLKRHIRTRRSTDESGKIVERNVERADGRTRASFMFIEHEEVNAFADEVRRKAAAKAVAISAEEEAYPVDGADEESPCVDRWSNLAADSKKKMWGSFDETGIFIAACRHGAVLLMCDMIRSGELAKYPLALVNMLIDTFGDRLLIGYDIGCGFSTTATNSEKVGPKVKNAKCSFCCNAFHGYAHCRKCQLKWHPLYLKGAGLEDFEGCERIFSESNNIARPTRHSTKFHRRQAILRHFQRWNKDKYDAIPRFLASNYKQALQTIVDCSKHLERAMRSLGIQSVDSFRMWHEEEFDYLRTLQGGKAEAIEQWKEEYVSLLLKLEKAEEAYRASTTIFSNMTSADFSRNQEAKSRAGTIAAKKTRGLDSVLTLQESIRSLEAKHGIDQRWGRGQTNWISAARSLAERDYDEAIDRLEGLVVARLFELGKMNKAETGYKLRRQIGKTLKARSKAVTAAVKQYNEAASKLDRPVLETEEVLNYVFLGQFDLLRGSRHGITTKPWSRSAERDAAVSFFKLERAREEIRRLHVELKRLFRYTKDVDARMDGVLSDLRKRDALLALQMEKRMEVRKAVFKSHLQLLTAINGWAGFMEPVCSALGATITSIDRAEKMLLSTETNAVELEIAEEAVEIEQAGFMESLAILSQAG